MLRSLHAVLLYASVPGMNIHSKLTNKLVFIMHQVFKMKIKVVDGRSEKMW